MTESELKTKKLIKYGVAQLKTKRVDITAATLKDVLDHISDIHIPKTEDGFYKLHIEQVIEGMNCTLNISKYKPDSDNNYMVGQVIIGDDTHLYISRI